ncbi:ornithine carbamoyltransferase [Oribacterium sp. KHPX15]|uniref:ornithine carbamoyltransferase n=1 Tax=Oribacterium sp. KHPX15 TaxID=1855342 RepID=UPI000895C8F9|nr:ornithine carbamoyltransferase [Oribacterium sp. KHPX15]
MADLTGRDFLKLLDYSPEEINYLLDIAARLKAEKKAGPVNGQPMHKTSFEGKNIALIFEKDSTRTRCSFEVAASDLGMGSTYLGPTGSQIGKKESIADTARVLSRMYDGIEYRGFDQSIVEELAKYSDVPVWNGLTNEFHPTQMLADMLTIREHKGELKGLKLVYMGDARYNMGDSYMVTCAKLGMHFVACAPEEYWPNKELIETCREIASKNGAVLEFTEDVKTACTDADVICTDVWVSMGESDEVWEKRIHDLSPYQVNAKAFSYAKKDAVFLHCLPSFHDTNTKIGKDIYEKYGLKEMEVTNEVFESDHSVVFDEAENRMHTIKAVIYTTLGGK